MTFLAGMLVGLAVSAFVGQRVMAEKAAPTTTEQRQEKSPQWEYSVHMLPPVDGDATREMNQLATDRWEFVGLIMVKDNLGGVPQQSNLFRRPQK